MQGGRCSWKAGSNGRRCRFSPADMDFINAKHVSAREIALAFGVPPMLLGIPGDNTYANYQEANRALWRQTILPLLDKAADALNGWLAPKFGPQFRLVYDMDAIPALSAERDAHVVAHRAGELPHAQRKTPRGGAWPGRRRRHDRHHLSPQTDIWRQRMKQILSRFSEASSWAAIGGILVLFGLHVPDALYQHLANVAAAIAFVDRLCPQGERYGRSGRVSRAAFPFWILPP